MPQDKELDAETLSFLKNMKDNVDEILADIADVVPEEYRVTCVLRYCGPEEGIPDLVYIDDVHDDVIATLNKDRMEKGI